MRVPDDVCVWVGTCTSSPWWEQKSCYHWEWKRRRLERKSEQELEITPTPTQNPFSHLSATNSLEWERGLLFTQWSLAQQSPTPYVGRRDAITIAKEEHTADIMMADYRWRGGKLQAAQWRTSSSRPGRTDCWNSTSIKDIVNINKLIILTLKVNFISKVESILTLRFQEKSIRIRNWETKQNDVEIGIPF